MKIFLGGMLPGQLVLAEQELRNVDAEFTYGSSQESEQIWRRRATNCDVAIVSPFCKHGHLFSLKCGGVPIVSVRGRGVGSLVREAKAYVERRTTGAKNERAAPARVRPIRFEAFFV